MPISKYFGGHGTEVMRSMRKKHGKRATEVFYRTANKKGMKPKEHGTMTMPKDIGAARQAESVKAGGFKAGTPVKKGNRKK